MYLLAPILTQLGMRVIQSSFWTPITILTHWCSMWLARALLIIHHALVTHKLSHWVQGEFCKDEQSHIVNEIVTANVIQWGQWSQFPYLEDQCLILWTSCWVQICAELWKTAADNDPCFMKKEYTHWFRIIYVSYTCILHA